MILDVLKASTRVWIACYITLSLLGCANFSIDKDNTDKSLPLGLYKVVEHECDYPSGAPEDCSQTKYIELVNGVFYGIGKDEAAFVTWLADNPDIQHEYIARDLRHGFFLNSHKFIVKDDVFSKEWFVIRNAAITDYYFIRHNRPEPYRNMAGETHLTLEKVARDLHMNRLLPYPSEVTE
jgi:hypothetical protein